MWGVGWWCSTLLLFAFLDLRLRFMIWTRTRACQWILRACIITLDFHQNRAESREDIYNETPYTVPPRRCISESKIRIFLRVFAQEETSLGVVWEIFIKISFLTNFTFLQNLQNQSQEICMFFYKGHKFFIKIYWAELAVSYLVRHSSATD